MVMWVNCPNCALPVDEFENNCHWCGGTEAVQILKEGRDEADNRDHGSGVCWDSGPRRDEARI